MKKLIIVLLGFLWSWALIAQEFQQKFGIVAKEEIGLTSYQNDPEAEAVVLFDVGESEFVDDKNGGYDIRFTRTRRTKVLKKSGADYAEVEIPFYVDGYGKTERVTSIQAYTYNDEDGVVIKKPLDPNTIYEETINERWRRKKFVFPDVKEGSVIEYNYVVESPFLFNLPDWIFQDRIPTIYSQYTVKMVPFYQYVFIVQGVGEFDYQNSEVGKETRSFGTVTKVYGRNIGQGAEFQDYIHTYAMKNIPAFKDESYITSRSDYIMKMDFQLSKVQQLSGATTEIITTWPKLIEELWDEERFGKYIKGCKKFAKKIIEEELSFTAGQDETSKVKTIVEYVRNSFSWNKQYSKYAKSKPADLFKTRIGNSAEINLFLLSLMNAAEIEAVPVIISLRNHGKVITDYPFLHSFNDVLVLAPVNGHYFLFDATQNFIGFNKIPPECINERGLIVEEGKEARWVDLKNSVLSVENAAISLMVDPENLTAKSRITIQANEFLAYRYKNAFNNDSTRLKEYFAEDFGMQNIFKIAAYNFDKNNIPYVVAFEGDVEIESLGEKLVISPFLEFPISENLLKQNQRNYPIDFTYAFHENLVSDIIIPEGYKAVYVPENFRVDDDLLQITINYTMNSGQVINSSANYTVKKPVYQPEDYERLKKHFDTIVERFNEQIVLEKI